MQTYQIQPVSSKLQTCHRIGFGTIWLAWSCLWAGSTSVVNSTAQLRLEATKYHKDKDQPMAMGLVTVTNTRLHKSPPATFKSPKAGRPWKRPTRNLKATALWRKLVFQRSMPSVSHVNLLWCTASPNFSDWVWPSVALALLPAPPPPQHSPTLPTRSSASPSAGGSGKLKRLGGKASLRTIR